MRKRLLALLLSFIPLIAFAGQGVVSWTNPTANTDGTPIAAGDLTQNEVYWDLCGTTPLSNKVTISLNTTYTVTNLDPGTWCFAVKAINKWGVASDLSNLAQKVIVPPTPNAPVVSDPVAYEIRVFPNQLKLFAVGEVPIGTPCGTQATDGYYFVDESQVDLKNSYKGGALVAKCST